MNLKDHTTEKSKKSTKKKIKRGKIFTSKGFRV
jgi:hypothetical protein